MSAHAPIPKAFLKCCRKCNTPKPNALFYKRSVAKDGIDCYCKECRKAIGKEWISKNIEQVKARARERHHANPIASQEQSKKWRLANPEKSRIVGNKWYVERKVYSPSKVELVCRACLEPFWLPPSKAAMYVCCSAECSPKYVASRIESRVRACKHCGKDFCPRGTQIAEGRGMFCSQACKGRFTELQMGGAEGTYRRRVVELSDSYVRRVIKESMPFLRGVRLPHELISAKREHMRINRLFKEIK